MAELHLHAVETPGILKEIDEGAMDLVFQAIQEDMYAHPIESFVRESISNALDAHTERDIAIDILNGAPIDKYYLLRDDGKLLKDSQFDPSYYDLKYIGRTAFVEVNYKVQEPRDLITIKDTGVGLHGSRLKGFFKLGYSSKRNLRSVIGKFGAGAKSALATGADFFTVTTTYNGFKTSFMIFRHDYEPITPSHPDGMEEVWKVKMTTGKVVDKVIYWEPTTDKNSVMISLEVKKHNRQAFIDAVRNQFQYFEGKVRFTYPEYTWSDSSYKTDMLKDEPVYQSDKILIPTYSTYNVPHILVDGISYGPISWKELELETRTGKIAIKVKATDVDITQSRETLKWTEKTKKVILAGVEQAKIEAEDYLVQNLGAKATETNVLLQIKDMESVSKSSESAALNVFSRFLDIAEIKGRVKIKLPNVEKIIEAKVDDYLFDALMYKYQIKIVSLNSYGKTLKLVTQDVKTFESLFNYKIVWAEAKSLGPKLAEHLLNKECDTYSFVYIRPHPTREAKTVQINRTEYDTWDVRDYVHPFLQELVDIDLDGYDVEYDESDELDGASLGSKDSLAKLRAMNQEVLYTIRKPYWYYSDDMRYETTRETIKVADIPQECKYWNKEHTVLISGSMMPLGKILEASHACIDTGTRFIHVSQETLPLFAPYCTLITDYFRTLNTNTGELMIGAELKKLNTIEEIGNLINKDNPRGAKTYKSFRNFETFLKQENNTVLNMNLYAEAYRTTIYEKSAMDKIFNNSQFSEVKEDVLAYLKSTREFQKVVRSGNKEEIIATSMELFNSPDIFAIDAYDEELVADIKKVLDRFEYIAPLMNEMKDGPFLDTTTELLNKLINTIIEENDHI